MKKILDFLVHFVVFALVLRFAKPVFAHGDEPRLEISPDRSNPGGVVDVRGFEFEREEVITLMLINSNSSLALGEVSADIEGIFLQIVTLPVDLAEGTYKILATTYDHQVYSPELTIQGPPILDGERGHEEGVREQEEPLIMPMPTFVPGVVPGEVLPPTIQPRPTTAESVSSRSAIANILSAFLIAGVLILMVLRIRRKR